MKYSVLKRFLSCMLAMVLLLPLAACGGDQAPAVSTEPTGSVQIPTGGTQPQTTTPTTTAPVLQRDTITVYAHVPSDWSAFCWAWSDQQNAFDVWPGMAMSKKDGWFSIEIPNWVTSLIISNAGTPQTDDLTVQKGKDVWVVVEADGSAAVSYSKPDLPNEGNASEEDMVTIHASVPANWLTPFCWAWSGTQNAFSTWPGMAFVKSGDWYEVQVPNWIDSLVLSNSGTPQTQDLSVTKGKDLWVVVKANGDVKIHETRPTLDAAKPSAYTMQHSDMEYVMVYNPNIYDEYVGWNTNSLETGVFASMSGGAVISHGENPAPASTTAVRSAAGARYKVGDTGDFYCTAEGSGATGPRALRKMTCAYAGEYCYVWSDGSLSSGLLQSYGQEFDSNVYPTMTDLLGEVAWVGEQGKVHLMFYPIAGGTAGYFSPNDMLSSSNVSAADAAAIQGNLDHTMLHFNTNMASTSNQESRRSILAHEFQHLLCYSAALKSGSTCRLWLNEVMSAYAEEYFRPGIKKQDGFVEEFNNSHYYKTGTSLYHFSQLRDAYGLVYCFGEYLRKNGGDDVFVKVHNYLRSSNGGFSEAKALYHSVSVDFRNKIEGSFDYSGMKFANKQEEWLSKLTLQFYLNMLTKEGNLPYHSAIKTASLLYTDKDALVVEGGGRIILPTDGNSFDIPGGADAGLIYIGLDKNFQVVTSYTEH